MSEAMAGLGHNGGPEPTPFEAIKLHIESLYMEAKNWADGTPIETQEQADKVSFLLDELRKAEAVAEDERDKEKRPLDEKVKEIQGRYNPLTADTKTMKGLSTKAKAACKSALAPFLKRLDDERAERLRLANEAAATKAAEAAQALRDARPDDLAAQEAAEAVVTDAKAAGRAAAKIGNTTAGAFGGSRAVTLRTYYEPEITDLTLALRHFYGENPEAFRPVAQKLAEDAVRSGKRSGIPGVTVREDRRPV
jgi:hypothetical protein